LTKEERQLIANLLMCSRKTAAHHLPIGHSFIPYDLLLQAYSYYIAEYRDQLNVKSLFAGLNHSEMGKRYHLNRLLHSGWVKIESHSADARMKSVALTEKTLARFDAISEELASILIAK
jgi:hypothetical protein